MGVEQSLLSEFSGEAPSLLRALTPDQQERLTVVLDRYLASLEEGKPLALESLCDDHPDLAEPLEFYLQSLTELHEAAAGFANRSDRQRNEPSDSGTRRLGDFELLREVGRGGMGVVYEARQISLGRRVALKVLPFAAVLDSRQITRFKNEAAAAAQLHHPHIVPVYAVGVERGVHYYAMQFIEGQPLDRAIEQLCEKPARGGSAKDGSPLTSLRTDRREYFHTIVRLGVQAAEALHAAHQEGVVHRDVKPSNLLIDGDGKLWVTDFGLARCQTDATLTRTGDIVGTMRYMSPEQAMGNSELVDQRSDVYSLGVTLYELLTLQPAFGGDDGPSLLRDIDRHEPIRPRQLQPNLPVDLETVVLKAMSRPRDERYTTARELADDLRRVLSGEPTLARPPSISDRAAKWARRHRRLVAAMASAGLIAVLGLAISTLLISREKANTDRNFERAERNLRDAQHIVDRFGAQLAERLVDVPGTDDVRRELLHETLGYYQRFAEQAADDPALQADLALTYGKIGTLAAQLGFLDNAITAHRNAVRLYEQLAAKSPRNVIYRQRLAVSENNLGLVLARAGQTDDARSMYRSAIERQSRLVADMPDESEYQDDLALTYNNLGMLQSETGESDLAAASYREAIELQQAILARTSDDPDALRHLASTYNNLGALFADRDANQLAKWYEKSLAHQAKAAIALPNDLRLQADVALTLNNLAGARSRSGNLAAAADAYGRAIEIQETLVKNAPAQQAFRRDLSVSYNNLGLAQSKLRDPSSARESFGKALELQAPIIAQNSDDIEVNSILGGIHNNLGIVLEEIGELDEASEHFRQAIGHQAKAVEGAPTVERYRRFLLKHYENHARVLQRLGRSDEAEAARRAGDQILKKDPSMDEKAFDTFNRFGQSGV